jgi:hypothetical protein
MELTLKQYTEQQIKECMAENECTRADAEYCVQGYAETEHFQACYKAAESGIALSRYVLDSLSKNNRYCILHDFPMNKHNGYMLPEARVANRANEEGLTPIIVQIAWNDPITDRAFQNATPCWMRQQSA